VRSAEWSEGLILLLTTHRLTHLHPGSMTPAECKSSPVPPGSSGGAENPETNIIPLLVIFLVSAFILLVGFGVFRAARSRPRTVSAFIGVAVAAGFGMMAYVALAAEADLAAVRWLAAGLALIILGCPAWVLVFPDGAANDPSPITLAEVAKLLFGYLAACWLLGLALAIFVHLTASPPGSLR
jgi:predicted membrane channel-forming protein YqfA (hemolysin III family)